MYPIVFIVVSMGAMPDDLMQSAVDRIIASRGFAGSERLRNFLRYITEETIAGRGELLKESQIGIHVYGRQPDYDPKIDAIVRVEAGRLRAKLEEYYKHQGKTDSVQIVVPKGSYVPALTSTEDAQGVARPEAEPPCPQPTLPRSKHEFRWRLAALVAVAILLGALAWPSYHRLRTSPGQLTIGVLPFENLSSDPSLGSLGDAMTDQVTYALSNEAGFLVASRTAAMQFKSHPQSLGAIGRKLNAAVLLESSVQRRDKRMHMVTQLVSVEDGYHLWSENYDFAAEEAPRSQDQVATLIARTLRARFAGVPNPRASQRCANPDAARLHARAQDEWLTLRKPGVEKAVALYEEAVARDPRCAVAYAGLGEATLFLATINPWGSQPAVEAARGALQRAIALDDRIPEAHAILGNILLFHDWNFPGAELELKHAVQLRPGPSHYMRWYALAATCRGHHEAAEEELRYANLANPNSESILTELGRVALEMGRTKEGEQYARQALAVMARYVPALFLLGLARELQNDHREAASAFEQCSASQGWGFDCRASLARLRILAGDRDEADRLENRIQKHTSKALLAITKGDQEAALAALERAASNKEQDVFLARNDPRFGPLRREPRFQAIWTKLGM